MGGKARVAGEGGRRTVRAPVDKAGYGLIETIRVREERIPFLDRHLARLGRSLGELGLPKPSQDIPALVRPFAATGDAVLRVEVRAGRARVLELVQRVVQGRYPAQELAGKSLFLTNAVRGILPIASLDGATVPADPRTAELAQRFWPTM